MNEISYLIAVGVFLIVAIVFGRSLTMWWLGTGEIVSLLKEIKSTLKGGQIGK